VERGWSLAPPCRAAGVVSRGAPLRRKGRRAPSRWSRRRGGSRQEEAAADQGRHDDTKDQGAWGSGASTGLATADPASSTTPPPAVVREEPGTPTPRRRTEPWHAAASTFISSPMRPSRPHLHLRLVVSTPPVRFLPFSLDFPVM
jgi:hypothetical protein